MLVKVKGVVIHKELSGCIRKNSELFGYYFSTKMNIEKLKLYLKYLRLNIKNFKFVLVN